MAMPGIFISDVALKFPSPEERDALCAFFEGAGYREDRVEALLGSRSRSEAWRSPSWMLERRTAGGSALEGLIRLFLGGFVLSPHDLEAAIGGPAIRTLERVGLVEPASGGLRATVQLAPSGSLWIACDRPERHLDKAADFVVGPSPVSRALADLTIRRPVHRCLDLGCGSGVQALLAAAHCQRVVAEDLNPRAVALTRFNAALNGLDNVEVAEGDLFAPVQGQRFDLIVCNPPYVISPDSTFLYRDGGSQVCARIVREAPAYLSTGGSLQMLCNWPQKAGQDWRAEVSGWLEDAGCDAWVLRLHSLAAEDYAMVWLTQEFGGQEVSAECFANWTGHLEKLGIESVGLGLIVMRPAHGRKPWLEVRDAPPIAGKAGESIARAMAARAMAAGNSDDELLDAQLRPSPDLEQRGRHRPNGEGWEGVTAELRLCRGLAFSARVDPVATALIGLLDGKRTLREALNLFAGNRHVPSEMFLEHLPAAIRRLLELGLVIPANEAS